MPDLVREVRFRPRARLVSVLGEQLISDQAVGLIELVKNAYDADATTVEVALEGLSAPETTIVVVRDNGCGMTAADVEEKWLSPAIDHKARQKAARVRTPRGRLPIGEKGVGRFAVQQLGHRLEMVTRAAGASEVAIRVDWDAFESSEGYLDDRTLQLVERPPHFFPGDATGTILRVTGARTRWTAAMVRKIQRVLRRLQSPARGHQDFTIILRCPDYPQYEHLDTTDILERAHYIMHACVFADGRMDYDYTCALPTVTPRREGGEDVDLTAMARSELSGPHPICGPLFVDLYVWDRTRDLLTLSRVSREDLDAQCGVSLFRDGLRVFPYGEQGDDWLQLDRERINDPSHRIGNNQVIGFAEVDQTANPDLRDKTNREGLIDNAAFQDMRALVRAVIAKFTNLWLQDRPRTVAPSERPNPHRREPPVDVKRMAQALEETVRDDVFVPATRLSATPANDPHAPAEGAQASNGASHIAQLSQRQAVQLLVATLEEARSERDAIAQDYKQEHEFLLGLAATGLAAERVAHEFGRQVVAALDALTELRRSLPYDRETTNALSVLEICLATLRSESRGLAPYAEQRRGERPTRTSVEEMARVALRLSERLIQLGHITASVSGGDFLISTRPASLVQVFDNLINNACWWLSADADNHDRRINVVCDPAAREVTVIDNGPGVPAELRDQLFLPMRSGRLSGNGLGLFIASELMKELGGNISLLVPADSARGARFVLRF